MFGYADSCFMGSAMDSSLGHTLVQDISLILGKPLHQASPELQSLDTDSIKRAFRKRAHQCHPDKASSLGFRPEILTRRFRELSEAHQRILSALNDGTYQNLLGNIQARSEGQSHGVAKTWRPSQSKQTPQGQRNQPATGSATDRTWTSTAETRGTSFFHKGVLPRLSLRLGQFLYYSGRIDWQTMIDALTWQYINRPLLGQIAKTLGYLQDHQILLVQRKRKPGECFGSAATRLGMIDRHRLNLALGRQRLMNLPLGKYFTQHHILTEVELQTALVDMHRHNLTIRRV